MRPLLPITALGQRAWMLAYVGERRRDILRARAAGLPPPTIRHPSQLASLLRRELTATVTTTQRRLP